MTLIDMNQLRQAEILQMAVWRSMEQAPRDGTVILVAVRGDLAERTGRPDLVRWQGRYAAVRWNDDATLWVIAVPVGASGLPDDWMLGWQPIDPTRKEPVR